MQLNKLIFILIMILATLQSINLYAQLPCFAAPCSFNTLADRAQCMKQAGLIIEGKIIHIDYNKRKIYDEFKNKEIMFYEPYMVYLENPVLVKGKIQRKNKVFKLNITDPQLCWGVINLITPKSIGQTYRFYGGKW